jgi:hypothetical protein
LYVGDSPFKDTVIYGNAPGVATTWGPITVIGNVGNYLLTLN